MKHKYFITGGGTGGHIYPAIAVADFLAKENIVYYVGNPNNMEYKIAKNYPFLPINIHGMPRKLSPKILVWGLQLLGATIKSMFYILKYKPDIVFGTGGYVSAPSLIAAKILNVPFYMHDCDATPGLVTRKLAPYAKGVSLAFDIAKQYIKNNNCYVTGNPIRPQFKTLTKEQARENLGLENKLTISIMGGSQGAESINEAVVKILEKLSENYNVIFQTGRKNYDKLNLPKENKNLIIKPYFDDMVTVLKASDIAISRAGSLSISELCASKVATIFVPYPYAAADHQRKNAKYMQENGAGIYLEDDDVTSDKLYELITSLTDNPQKLEELQNNALKMAKFDGIEEIVNKF